MSTFIIVILIGFTAGVLSGAFGIGGGIVLVPALVYFLAYSQKMAQGTTLAMLMFPVVGLGVYNYYQEGNVSLKSALLLGIGFIIGGYLGSKLILLIPSVWKITEQIVIYSPLKKLFAILMLFIAVKMLFSK